MTSDILITSAEATQATPVLGAKTSKTPSENAPANDETFARIIESSSQAQQEVSTHTPENSQTTEETNTPLLSDQPTTVLSQETENILFFTYRTDTPTSEASPPSSHFISENTVDSDTPVDQIAALMNNISPGYEKQDTENNEITSDQVISADKQQDTPNVNTLLSLFPSINTDDGTNKGNIDLLKNALSSQTGFDILLSDLSPEERTKIQELITKALTGTLTTEEQESLDILASQVIGITAPPAPIQSGNTQTRDTAELAIQTNTQQRASASQPAPLPQQQETAAGNNTTQNLTTATTEQTQLASSDLAAFSAPDDETAPQFKELLARNETSRDTNTRAETTPQTQNSPLPGNVPTPPNTVQDSVTPLLTTDEATLALSTSAFNQQTPVQSTLTQSITQSPNATAPHPATQMVSATIQKAVKAGEDTNIRLMLDPPELGRVEVKMSIDQDNNSKIVLTAEKPETYMMLRRDADALERALNENGLDTQSELSFEMAQDNQMFEKQDQGDDASSSGTNGADDGEPEIIETKMNWDVDPQTGYIRYDILA